MKKREDFKASPALHFSPPSSCSTPATQPSAKLSHACHVDLTTLPQTYQQEIRLPCADPAARIQLHAQRKATEERTVPLSCFGDTHQFGPFLFLMFQKMLLLRHVGLDENTCKLEPSVLVVVTRNRDGSAQRRRNRKRPIDRITCIQLRRSTIVICSQKRYCWHNLILPPDTDLPRMRYAHILREEHCQRSVRGCTSTSMARVNGSYPRSTLNVLRCQGSALSALLRDGTKLA